MATFGGANIVTDNLVLWLDAASRSSYPGSGATWTDMSGNSNNGILNNAPIFNNTNNGTIILDGIDDFITINNNSSLNFGTSNFSVGVWYFILNTSIVLNREYGLIDKSNTFQSSAGWGMEFSSYGASAPFNTIFHQVYNTGQGGWGDSNIGMAINTNRWNYCIFTRTSNTFYVYLNGILSAERTNASIGLDVSNASNIVMGKNTWGVYNPVRLSNVQIYNRALSASEVQQNYDALKSRYLNQY